MNRDILRSGLGKPSSRKEIVTRYCAGRSVLDLGCINHNRENTSNPNWLHGHIRSCAKRVLGVDILEDAVSAMRDEGFDIIAADVTAPWDITEQFDVVVIGNLIEHLANFSGLFANLERVLRPRGRVLICTPNPFYREQYFYSAFKNDIIVNEEHTCWIDPVTLDQLARRFGFATESVHWVREKWSLHEVIMHGPGSHFDIMTSAWSYAAPPSPFQQASASMLMALFRLASPERARRTVTRYGAAQTKRLLYTKAQGYLFGSFWYLYRKLVVTARINWYELYFSVLTSRDADYQGEVRASHG